MVLTHQCSVLRGLTSVLLLLLFHAAGCPAVCAQEVRTVSQQPYKRGFTFKSGIYLSFEDFKFNQPVPLARVRYANGSRVDLNELADRSESSSFRSLLIEESDTSFEVNLRDIWGISNGLNIYIVSKERGVIKNRPLQEGEAAGSLRSFELARIPIIGAICHFTDFDPEKASSAANPNAGRTPIAALGKKNRDIDQYLLVMETGLVHRFDREGMHAALAGDPEMQRQFYAESSGLKYEKMLELLYVYLHRFNKKHVLYFPVDDL